MTRDPGVGCRAGLVRQPVPPQFFDAGADYLVIVGCSGLWHQTSLGSAEPVLGASLADRATAKNVCLGRRRMVGAQGLEPWTR